MGEIQNEPENNAKPELDFVISFGAVAHAGLGRFGYALNPFGDLEAVARIWCLLKPGGMLYLSAPIGRQDKVMFNMQRVYGPMRLPHLLANWEQVDKAGQDAYNDIKDVGKVDRPGQDPNNHRHVYKPFFVLQKKV